MIIEYIRYTIPADQEHAFLSAYRAAATELRGSEHCLDYEISRCVEEPASFVVRIRWELTARLALTDANPSRVRILSLVSRPIDLRGG